MFNRLKSLFHRPKPLVNILEHPSPLTVIDTIHMSRYIDKNQQAVVYMFTVPMNVRFTEEPDDEDKEILGEEPETIADVLLQLSVIADLSMSEGPTVH